LIKWGIPFAHFGHKDSPLKQKIFIWKVYFFNSLQNQNATSVKLRFMSSLTGQKEKKKLSKHTKDKINKPSIHEIETGKGSPPLLGISSKAP
jgi:hypothetical protein